MRLGGMVVSMLLAAGVFPLSVQARAGSEIPYGYEQIWSAVIRLVRVDLRMTIDERDKELGFVLFQYREGKREFPGSIEIVQEKDQNQKLTMHAVVQIPGMPAYVEQVMLDQLKRKLKDDYGPPLAISNRQKSGEKDGNSEKKDGSSDKSEKSGSSERFDTDSKGSTMRERDANRSKVRGD